MLWAAAEFREQTRATAVEPVAQATALLFCVSVWWQRGKRHVQVVSLFRRSIAANGFEPIIAWCLAKERRPKSKQLPARQDLHHAFCGSENSGGRLSEKVVLTSPCVLRDARAVSACRSIAKQCSSSFARSSSRHGGASHDAPAIHSVDSLAPKLGGFVAEFWNSRSIPPRSLMAWRGLDSVVDEDVRALPTCRGWHLHPRLLCRPRLMS